MQHVSLCEVACVVSGPAGKRGAAVGVNKAKRIEYAREILQKVRWCQHMYQLQGAQVLCPVSVTAGSGRVASRTDRYGGMELQAQAA